MHQEQDKKEALRISCALDLTLYYRLQRIAFTIVKCTHDQPGLSLEGICL